MLRILEKLNLIIYGTDCTSVKRPPFNIISREVKKHYAFNRL